MTCEFATNQKLCGAFAPVIYQDKRYCRTHFKENITILKCSECDTIPRYSAGGKLFCGVCLSKWKDGFVIKCENCGMFPATYAMERWIPTHCSGCRTLRMVNLQGKKCEFEGCVKSPSFGYESAVRCKKHKLEDMTNLTSRERRSCEYQDGDDKCEIIPSFNYAGTKQGMYCAKHKLPDMINVKTILCQCGVVASYSSTMGGRPEVCSGHKTDKHYKVK